ncbi:hypothetical protein CBR_g36523 [Chara braunii]|uniref:CCHC-type domain-containing protein n=1 Tax=Chara braunii TaxID=69332 RepID=A0A388LL11_CHABU|nr:hypothetical protein CBR_g36523 [Chara braunii]|eukprot:GBG82994.1 hypothetical protein CBR_g36523 [Chara braunii]
MSNSDRREENQGSGDGDRRQYRAPTCFNCHEPGHYANQCPHRDRRYYSSRPSTSTSSGRPRSPRRYEARRAPSPTRKDSELREQLVELTHGVAIMREHIDAEKAKKEAKARRKLEREREKEEERRRMEEEEARRAEEEDRREAKLRKKQEKAKKEATTRAEMKKEVTLHAAMLMSEIKDDWIRQWKTSMMPVTVAGNKDEKGKKRVEYGSDAESSSGCSSEGSETSVTQELSEKTRQLCITEKRKREEDVPLEGSPPMELPPKRTPYKGGIKITEPCERVTRSKARRKCVRTPIPAKMKTPVKTLITKTLKSAKKKTPPSGRITPANKALLRLRYRDAIIRELKDCAADELQRICKEEGLHYDGKIDAILDIAEYRSRVRFAGEEREVEVIPVSDSTDAGPENVPEGTQG